MRRVWRRTKTIRPALQERVHHPLLSRLEAYETRPERCLHDSAGFVSYCFASGDGGDQRVASPGVVCKSRSRRRGSAERRAGLRASTKGGALAPEEHLFLRSA